MDYNYNRRGPEYGSQISPSLNQQPIKLFDAKKRVDITKPSLIGSANLIFNSYHSLPVEQQFFRRVRRLEPQSQIAEQVIMSPPRYMRFQKEFQLSYKSKQPVPIFEKPIVNSLIAPRDSAKNTLFSNVSIYKDYDNQFTTKPYSQRPNLEYSNNFYQDQYQNKNTYANAAKSMLRSL